MDSKNPSGAKSRAEVYDWIQCIIFALVFCVLLFVFAVRMVNVVGHSMVPTLEQSDKVVISNLFYHPKQGDVVVLRKQTLMQEPIVKRIIATEGQTVDIDFNLGQVYVDGELLDEDYGIMTRVGLHCAPSAHQTLGTYPTGTIRFSFGWWNTEAEVERALEALRELEGRASWN